MCLFLRCRLIPTEKQMTFNEHHWPPNGGTDIYVNFNVNLLILIMVFKKKDF